jgi:hypothetical protein
MNRYEIKWRFKRLPNGVRQPGHWTCYLTSESWGQVREEFIEPASDENVLKEPKGSFPIDGRDAKILSIVRIKNEPS